MKDFFKILKYIKPYFGKTIWYTIFNGLSVVFALFSFTMVFPFLKILFTPDKLVTEPVEFSFNSEAIIHNFFYFLSGIIKTNGAITALMYVCLAVIIATLLKTGFMFLGRYFLITIENSVVKDINLKIYNKILGLPLSFFSSEKKGDLMSRFSSDVSEIKIMVSNFMKMIIRDPLSIIIFLSYLFFSNFYFTLFILIFLPIIGIIIGKIGLTLKKKSFVAQTTLGLLVSRLEETLTGLKVIKIFNAEQKVRQSFKKLNNNYYRLKNSVEHRKALSSPLSEFLGTIGVISIMYFGGILVLGENSSLSSEEFIAYLVVFSQILTPAKSLSRAYFDVQKGLASQQRIEEVLFVEDTISEIKNPASIIDFKSEIELKNVSFKYDTTNVLKNINLKIKKGETIALVGESGSGKSTLVDLIPRFYDITEGEIIIDGLNIKKYKISDLRKILGNVNQETILFNNSIKENIAFSDGDYSLNQVESAAKIANAHNFILEKPKKYDENIGEGGSKLSGGQRQRLSIARAVLKNPPIMILDEATSALDTESEKIVQNALENLMKDRTSIVIAHRLSTVKNADRIYVLQNGEIIEQGKHKELYEMNGNYKKLCDLQMV